MDGLMTPYFEDQPEPGSLVLDAFAAPTNGTSSFSDKVNYLILVFKNMSPYHFGAFGLACCIGPSVLGAAWGIFMIAPSLFGAAVRVPRIWSLNLISIIFCEAVALYGVIITIILIQKQKDIPLMSDGSLCPFTRSAGFAVMGSGMATGFTNLVCGVCVGICGSGCALADAQNNKLCVKILVIEIFATALGLFGVIVGIIMAGQAQFEKCTI